jgi:hypothetical protein
MCAYWQLSTLDFYGQPVQRVKRACRGAGGKGGRGRGHKQGQA